jgi:outer membrane receptor protein involved in Fe transport
MKKAFLSQAGGRGALLLGGLLVAAATGAQAQSIVKGQLLDQQKKAGVSFATVVLKTPGAAGKVVQSALADEAGHFVLQGLKPGSYQLSVLMLGFAPYEQSLQLTAGAPPAELGAVPLQPTATNLQEVTVVGQKPLLEQKPDRITMNVAQSVLAAGNDAYSILGMAPSVQVVDGRVTFRGKSGVLILLNGKRLPSGTSLENVLASIPGDQIERIELISNPSAKYDADASGGVIEIYTKRSQTLGWNANLAGNVSQGIRTAEGLSGGLRASSAKFDFTASGGFNNRNGVERALEERTLYSGLRPSGSLRQASDFLTTIRDGNFSGSLNYHLGEQQTIGVDVQLVRASLTAGGLIEATISQPAGQSLSSSQNDASLRVDLNSYNAFYQRNLDKAGSSLLITGNYAQYVSRQQQTFDQRLRGPQDSVATSSVFRNSAPATYNIYTAAADYVKVLRPTTRLESGLKYTATQNDSRQEVELFTTGGWQGQPTTPFSQLGYQEHIGAGYLNLNHTAGKWTLQAGLRAEQTSYRVLRGIDSTYFNLFPNVRADYKASANYTTSLAYAKNINRPAYENLIPYELFINNYTSRKGNARLRPEYAHSFSWNHLYKGYGLQLAYTQTTNAISTVYLYEPATLRFVQTVQNFRERHLASATLTAPVQPAKWWSINNSAGVLYQTLSFPDPSQENALYTKSRVYYNVSTDHTFTLGKGWTAQVYGVYNSPSFSGILDYGAYSNVRLGVRKTMLDKRASLKLEVVDLFYQANVRVSSDVAPVVTTNLTRTDTRRVRLSFTYKFGKADLKSRQVKTQGNADELGRLAH